MYDTGALKLYTDGSALENPGQGGYAVIAEYPDEIDIPSEIVDSCGYEETTNNRMELRAVIEAMRFARRMANTKGIRRVIIISDSEYVCKLQDAAIHWKKNDWRNQEGRPLDNHDLWNEFLTLRTKVRAHLEVVWEKGKSRQILKDVDRAAKAAAEIPSQKDFGFQKARISRTKVKQGTASMFPAKGLREIIRVFSYEYRSDEELMVTFDLYSSDSNTFVAKHYAYLTKDVFIDIHRHKCYEVMFNNNPKYPKFLTLAEVNSDHPCLAL